MCFITNTQGDERNPFSFKPILRMNLYGDGSFSYPINTKDDQIQQTHSQIDRPCNQPHCTYQSNDDANDIFTVLDPPIHSDIEDPLYDNSMLFLRKHYDEVIMDPYGDQYLQSQMTPNRLDEDSNFLPSRRESYDALEDNNSAQKEEDQYPVYLPEIEEDKSQVSQLYNYMDYSVSPVKQLQNNVCQQNYAEYHETDFSDNHLQELSSYQNNQVFPEQEQQYQLQQEQQIESSPNSMPSSANWNNCCSGGGSLETTHFISNSNSPQHTANIEEEHNEIMTRICNSNKKNVVKNLMSAFKRFISDLQTDSAASENSSVEGIKHHSKISNLRQNLTCGGYEIDVEKERKIVIEIFNGSKPKPDSIDEMGKKFKRYISLKQFNHYTIRLLVQHPNYGDVFRYFIESHALNWLSHSKVDDPNAHRVMIEFLKVAFDDISIIEKLKKHEKRKALFQ